MKKIPDTPIKGTTELTPLELNDCTLPKKPVVIGNAQEVKA